MTEPEEKPKNHIPDHAYDFLLDADYELMEEMGEIGPEWRGKMSDYNDAMNEMPEMTKQFQPSPDVSIRGGSLNYIEAPESTGKIREFTQGRAKLKYVVTFKVRNHVDNTWKYFTETATTIDEKAAAFMAGLSIANDITLDDPDDIRLISVSRDYE